MKGGTIKNTWARKENLLNNMQEKIDVGPYRTAVDWLKNELESNYGDSSLCEITWEELDVLIDKAKEMEKEQIINAHIEGQPFATTVSAKAEQYYNDMYGK